MECKFCGKSPDEEKTAILARGRCSMCEKVMDFIKEDIIINEKHCISYSAYIEDYGDSFEIQTYDMLDTWDWEFINYFCDVCGDEMETKAEVIEHVREHIKEDEEDE